MERGHERAMDRLEAKGIPVMERNKGKSFDDLMEEKLRKQGKSWKNQDREPAKRARRGEVAESRGKDALKGTVGFC